MFDSYDDSLMVNSATALMEREKQKQMARQKELQENIAAQQAANEPILRMMQEQIKKAEKDAKRAKIFSWITFGVATVLSIISILIAILK